MTENKFTYQLEVEVEAEPRQLYSLLSTPQGLEQWFCDQAEEVNEGEFNLVWNNKNHITKHTQRKKGVASRLTFLPDANEKLQGELPFVDFQINKATLDDTLFLKITDYTKNTDSDALARLWAELVNLLKLALDENP